MEKRVKKIIFNIPYWMGTSHSIVLHTLLFVLAFLFILLGVSFDRVMLVLTTAVSLEAIYLSLFIQMTVNSQHKRIRDIENDVDDILEDTESLTKEEKKKIINKINDKIKQG